VAKVSYATSLMRQGVLISTTEHLLSALIGMGVDNVIVELDNLELPILDGSALPYVEAFLQVGIRTQRRRRETIRVLHAIEVREGTSYRVYPAPATASSMKSISRSYRQARSVHRPGCRYLWRGHCPGPYLWLQGR